MNILNIIIIILCIITILLLINWENITENFNGSGFGFRKSFTENSIFIPLNDVSKSTDFKLLSYINQLKNQILKDEPNYKITKTEQGIIPHSSKNLNNIIVFPGLSDVIISQNNNTIWPIGKKTELINDKYKSIVPNNNGHFKTLYYILENNGYKNINNLTLQLRQNQNKLTKITNQSKVNTITYNFYDLNLDEIKNQFEAILENYIKNKNKKTVIIGYDSGCIIANLCILYIKTKKPELYDLIDKNIYISPTFGGTALSIKEYINAFKNNEAYKYNSDELFLNLPIDSFYDKPVIIYNSLGYNSNNIINVFEILNGKSDNKKEKFKHFQELHKYSLNNTGIKTLILFSEEDKNNQTPICYNYKKDLLQPPERYYLPNNNKTASYETIENPEGTIEGLTEDGDQIVPIKNILNLKKLWGDNCEIIKIKNKNHFTILKSYELALLLTKNLI